MRVIHTFPVKGTQKYTFTTELQMFAKENSTYQTKPILNPSLWQIRAANSLSGKSAVKVIY